MSTTAQRARRNVESARFRTRLLGAKRPTVAAIAKPKNALGPALRAGDIVDIVAPGFACSLETVKAGAHWLEAAGLKPRFSKKLFGPDVLSSNSDENRAENLISALRAPDSKAVWCVRGGYGSIRLLPYLAKERRASFPTKILVGLSDISSLFVFLENAWGWQSIHGPLLDRFGQKRVRPKAEKEMLDLMFGRIQRIEFKNLRPMNAEAQPRAKRKAVSGTLAGGNLIVLQSTLGTPWQIQGDGRILFFEELGERGYRVDRALEHMRQAGVFRNVRAVIFGDFLGGDEPQGGNRVQATLKRFAIESDFPVFNGMPLGHGELQRPAAFGARAELTFGAKGILSQNLRFGKDK